MATEKRATSRNRNSAKRAGAKFEIDQANYLRYELQNPYISRQDKNGGKDLGDIAYVGFQHQGVGSNRTPIVLECKNTASVNLTGAMREATQEAYNYQEKHGGPHPLPVVMHKRHGVGAEGAQWVTMEAQTFARLLRLAQGETE